MMVFCFNDVVAVVTVLDLRCGQVLHTTLGGEPWVEAGNLNADTEGVLHQATLSRPPRRSR